MFIKFITQILRCPAFCFIILHYDYFVLANMEHSASSSIRIKNYATTERINNPIYSLYGTRIQKIKPNYLSNYSNILYNMNDTLNPDSRKLDLRRLSRKYRDTLLNSPLSTNNNNTLFKRTTKGLDVELNLVLNSLFTTPSDKITGIFPGTVWCGNGNRSSSSTDFGLFFLTDHCCRNHDNCPKNLKSGESGYGLQNPGIFTRSHCVCDQAFYNCLKQTNTIISNQIGFSYFNILGPQCFREEHPVVGCSKRQSKACISYLIDEKKPKTWQWFDNKIY